MLGKRYILKLGNSPAITEHSFMLYNGAFRVVSDMVGNLRTYILTVSVMDSTSQ